MQKRGAHCQGQMIHSMVTSLAACLAGPFEKGFKLLGAAFWAWSASAHQGSARHTSACHVLRRAHA